MSEQTPVQPVEKPVLCSPYNEPDVHWAYNPDTGQAQKATGRRPAGYWFKTDKVGSRQQVLFVEEQRDDLPLVNRLRQDVRRWRESGYRGATKVTRDLLRYWRREDRWRRLFFCQLEAAETLIYLAEMRLSGRSGRTGFRKFEVSDDDLNRLLSGEVPQFDEILGMGGSVPDFFPTLVDPAPEDLGLVPLRRLGCKMATGSGKTVVMAMLISWAFCNRGHSPSARRYPNAVLVVCPNLTVKERLQVLRPERSDNYYAEFDMVPTKYRPLLQTGKVLVTNWHGFQPESEHREGDKSYPVVQKGPETLDVFARRVLGDLYDRMPVMVFNDEGHHCWRGAPAAEKLTGEERKEIEAEKAEATVWVEGLDKLNSVNGADGEPGIALCVDLSATPFFIKGSGHPEGRPFPWLVNDFGLVDAIESGIVKVPRLPVMDTTGRPDPKYFKLWGAIREGLQPGELLPGRAKKPKPDVVYREAEGALLQIAGQWVERFKYVEEASPGQENVPPVLIIVCDNTDIAEVFFQKISGERVEEVVTEDDVDEVLGEGEEPTTGRRKRRKKPKKRTVFGEGVVYAEHFSNTASLKRTIRIDSKLLAEAESDDPSKKKRQAAEELRRVVASVGKPGQPGEHVRCVVSVSMLTEGWDANNVTHILGLRAFGSQLLCEQVVGRGLRRMDYTPDPETGLLPEEYVDVYGIPFSVIPFKGRPTNKPQPEDKPKNHVKALPERKAMEIRFPVVEGYHFALRRNLIRCDVGSLEPLSLEPNREPTATFVRPTVGYQEGHPSQHGGSFEFIEQNRQTYYESTHPQAIRFQITGLVIDELVSHHELEHDSRRRVLRLQSRHQLFPQVFTIVDEYVGRKVDFKDEHPCELGLAKYVRRIVERLRDGIVPDDTAGEPPFLPALNRYKPMGTTADVSFTTTRPCQMTVKSHINQVVLDTKRWEASTAFRMEQSEAVAYYARNDTLGLVIPYEYQGVDHSYTPDFLVRLTNDVTIVLEVKGYEDDQTKAKHAAAKRWEEAVNNWGKLGRWRFHVTKRPQMVEREIAFLLKETSPPGTVVAEDVPDNVLPFRRVEPSEVRPFVNAVPLYDLKVAAGRFGAEQIVDEIPQFDELAHPEDYEWVSYDGRPHPERGLFVAQIVGESMNRRIPDGAYCLWRLHPAGSRGGKVVLAQHRDIDDDELGGHYTVKVYESEKEHFDDETWKHKRITLKPSSTDPSFKPIVLEDLDEGELEIIAELVGALG